MVVASVVVVVVAVVGLRAIGGPAILRSPRARRGTVAVLVVAAALGAWTVVRTVPERPAEGAGALRTTRPIDAPSREEQGPVTLPAAGAPASTAHAEDASPLSRCPLFGSYRDASVAAQRLALAPRDSDGADRHAYDVALARLRQAFPSLPGEIDAWDHAERQWIDEVQRRMALSPGPGHTAFATPAFMASVDRIQHAIDQGCGPRS